MARLSMTAESGASGGTAAVVVGTGVATAALSAGVLAGGAMVVGGTTVVVGCSAPGRTATTAFDSYTGAVRLIRLVPSSRYAENVASKQATSRP